MCSADFRLTFYRGNIKVRDVQKPIASKENDGMKRILSAAAALLLVCSLCGVRRGSRYGTNPCADRGRCDPDRNAGADTGAHARAHAGTRLHGNSAGSDALFQGKGRHSRRWHSLQRKLYDLHRSFRRKHIDRRDLTQTRRHLPERLAGGWRAGERGTDRGRRNARGKRRRALCG